MTKRKRARQTRPGRSEQQRLRDAVLVERLREGDQTAFLELFNDWHPSMVRVALNYVRGRSVAEEVAQEAWLHFMQQLSRFAGRSSLKTWTFRILVNRAINRGKREHRTKTLLRHAASLNASTTRPVGGDLTRGAGSLARARWASGGKPSRDPEQNLLDAETRAHLEEAIRRLPERQRLVLTLRDIQGWPSAEVCELLEISAENQRVILHRARVRVRNEVAGYLGRG